MGNEAAYHRPPSPPHSSDGDFGLNPDRVDHYQEPFTPPRTGAYGSPAQYPPIPQQVYYTPQPLHYQTPPNATDPGIMTRSGRTLGSPIEPKHHGGKTSRSTRSRKSRNFRGGKKGVPIIDQPLSVLTRDYEIPVRDMGAWVNRSVEDRLKEVEKKKGYVSRPMNSFMLYRSAYAERVKQFCKENNHQVVSQVTGQSWPLEPSNVRERYEHFAIVERDNHAAAHPTYKFAPNKCGKKRGRDDNDSDSDEEWRGSSSVRRSRLGTASESRSLSSTPFDQGRMNQYSAYQRSGQPHPSSYQAINPHRPPPMILGPAGLIQGYYQHQTVPYGQHVDDVKFGRIDDSYACYDTGSHMIGMPDGTGSELLTAPDGMDGQAPMDQILDPQLVAFDPNYPYDHLEGTLDPSLGVSTVYGYGTYPLPTEAIHVSEQAHPGMVTLTEGWRDGSQVGTDFDSELQEWN